MGIVGCILFFKCLILGCNCAILNSKALESLYFLKLLYGYDLAEGDEVYLIDGSTAYVAGAELEKLAEPIKVYNLEVADFNTYFVGDEAVLVHNYPSDAGDDIRQATTNVDPQDIRFSQDSISSRFKNGNTVSETIDNLKTGELTANDFPNIRVVERDGKLYTLDNRRLYCFQEAGLESIPVIFATLQEQLQEAFKFTTRNDGLSI